MKEKFDITGMTCSSCSSHVEKAVKGLNGADEVSVNLLQNSMSVSYDDKKLSADDIIEAVEKSGYGASRVNKSDDKVAEKEVNVAEKERLSMKKRLIISLVFLVPLLYISMGAMMGLPIPKFLDGVENAITYAMAQLLLTLPIMYVNRKYYESGFKSLFHKAPTMDTLIAIGSMAAVVYGIYAIIEIGHGLAVQDFELVHKFHMDLYFESAGTILTLITVGKYLESRSKSRTSDAISRLVDLSPKTALIEKDGEEIEISASDVKVDDVLIVKAGSTVPVDAVVIEGTAAIDESPITGESIPVEKSIGDSVTGATMSKSGYIKVKATRVGEDTTLSQIIQLVEDASASKAPIARLADKVSGVFVPIVISIAVLATIIWLILGYPVSFALSIGIAVLVISCPCALGLATPTAIMVGTGKAAENGIIFKNAESIETAHLVNTIVLDKTGTVTEGKPRVAGIYTSNNIEENELLKIAASAEKMSEHPLGLAIVERAEEEKLELIAASDFTQTEGQGISVKLNEERIIAGNARMMVFENVDTDDFEKAEIEIAEKGQTPLYFAKNGELLGVISVADPIKQTSKDAIAEMKAMGIEVILLTGDNERTAKAIGNEVGIENVIAGVLPHDKEAQVRKLQDEGKKVAMIGDGINDAPALVRSDVGIAIGAGTDVAIDSADVVLMKSDLLDAVSAIQLSRATIRNIKQNLFWAFFYNALGIPLAAGVFYPAFGVQLSPMFASAAMSLSSIFVVTNALRLRFWKVKRHNSKHKNIESNISVKSYNKEKENNKTKENKIMKIKIEGMSCNHCKARVEEALNSLDGVSAEVNLEEKTATVKGSADKELLKKTVEDAGYEVISVEEE